MTSSNTQYAMEGEAAQNVSNTLHKKRPRNRRAYHVPDYSNNNNNNDDDDQGSLTYSAASSTSSAGESTDSSLADIMKALEGGGGDECKKDTSMQKKLDKIRTQQHSCEGSVASSLNYSTDGESALNGEHLLQTITGQPSDSYGPDGGGLGSRKGERLDNLLFCEADPSADTKVDSKFSRKVKTPKVKNTSRAREEQREEEQRNRIHPRSSTPPTVPRRNRPVSAAEDEVWYAKWWMCGFTDAFRDLVPKR